MPDPNFYPLLISSVQPATDTAICVAFKVPQEHRDSFNFVPGQFLTLKATINGEAVRRAYSICSGVGDNTLRVAIKPRCRRGIFQLRQRHVYRPVPP